MEIKDVPHVFRKSPDDTDCEAIFAQYRRGNDGRYKYVSYGHMLQLSHTELRNSTRQVHYIPRHGIWQGGYKGKKL